MKEAVRKIAEESEEGPGGKGVWGKGVFEIIF